LRSSAYESEPVAELLANYGLALHMDITFTVKNESAAAPIAVPLGDKVFDPFSTGNITIPFKSALMSEGRHMNAFTPHVDLSGLYGYETTRAAEMRLFNGNPLFI
jgi:hypothetical protein